MLERASATEALLDAGAALRDWLLMQEEIGDRFLTACLHLGREVSRAGASDVSPTRISFTAGEIMGDVLPGADALALSAFFCAVFGTEESSPPPLDQRSLRDSIRRSHGPSAHTNVATLRDCRSTARALGLAPPPPQLLSAWSAAAARINAGISGPHFGHEIAEILRQHPLPQTAPKPVAEREPAPPSPEPAAVQLTVDQRIEAALRTLQQRGEAPVRRVVPGRYHLSLTAKLLGRVGDDVPVEVEPAFPLGVFTWSQPGPRGTDRYEDLPTGITPSRRIVPMTRGTRGDRVDAAYTRWKLGVDNSSGLGVGTTLFPETIAAELERLAGRSAQRQSRASPSSETDTSSTPADSDVVTRHCVTRSCDAFHVPTTQSVCDVCVRPTQAR